MSTWHFIASEFPPQPGGISDYSAQVVSGLEAAGQEVRVWSREFADFTPRDLRRVGKLMDAYPAPRRVLLQWAPQGFGLRSMNVPFCLWLAGRHDELSLMVHELGFGEGASAYGAEAVMHRAMLAILLRAASRVWVPTEAWQDSLRPLTFGRKPAIEWLPVPSNIPVAAGQVPETYDVGYFGQYDTGSISQLTPILDSCDVLAMGRGSERIRHRRATVTGALSAEDLSYAIASCRVMLHIYPDGVSGRRGALMASLAHGKAVVTNKGCNTEHIFSPLAIEPAELLPAVLRFLRNEPDRQSAAQNSRQLYEAQFTLERTIAALCTAQPAESRLKRRETGFSPDPD